MENMVEKIAFAIWAKAAPLGTLHFKDMLESDRERWREGARAAIEAMREPTEEMLAAGDSLAVPDEGYYPGAGPVWVIMNDAALNPTPSPSDTNQQPSP